MLNLPEVMEHVHLELVLLALLACVFVYSILTRAIAATIVTLPIIFMAIGYAFSHPLEMLAEPEALSSGKRLLAEVTLVLVLFSDASHVRFKALRENFQLPARMLIVGLPLTLALGTSVAYILSPASGLAMALLTAAVLTPTDAALGQTVVSSTDVPERLRQTINVESGLNDGLVLPFVLFGAILAAAGMQDAHTEGLAVEALMKLSSLKTQNLSKTFMSNTVNKLSKGKRL